MQQTSWGLIPELTTSSGSCLTPINWKDAGIRAGAVSILSLLIKPGLAVLQTLPELQKYFGWHGPLVMELALSIGKNGRYLLRSPLDGARIEITRDQLNQLLAQIQPEVLLIAAEIGESEIQNFPSSSMIFMAPQLHSQGQGIFLRYDARQDWTQFLAEVECFQNHLMYVAGDFELSEIQILAKKNIFAIQSDNPAKQACSGKVYTAGEVIDITKPQYVMDFRLIDEGCQCQTCSQKLTRAYLHHLLAQTPLLCQRFLIQHNVHFANTFIC